MSHQEMIATLRKMLRDEMRKPDRNELLIATYFRTISNIVEKKTRRKSPCAAYQKGA